MDENVIKALIVYWRIRCQEMRQRAKDAPEGSLMRRGYMTWAMAYAQNASMLDDLLLSPDLRSWLLLNGSLPEQPSTPQDAEGASLNNVK